MVTWRNWKKGLSETKKTVFKKPITSGDPLMTIYYIIIMAGPYHI